MRLRLALVDDHPVVRVGLTQLLSTQPDFELVGEAEDVSGACQMIALVEPDVLLLDLRIPGGGGIAVLRHLAAAASKVHSLVLTTYRQDEDISQALDAGALGYLLKDCPKDLLFSAIRSVAQGQLVLTPEIDQRRRHQQEGNRLSSREIEMLRALAREDTNRAIAAQLFISEATVKTHLQHIYEKLGCKQRTAAVLEAVRRGLISLGES